MDTSRTGRPMQDQPDDAARREDGISLLRVVVLAGRAGQGESFWASVQAVPTASPYEAAAEILAAPTAALVVDLRLVIGRHMRLLEIARQMEVEVLAVGAVPAGLTSEDLSGVRLIARADLPVALSRLAGANEPSPAANVPNTPAEEEIEPEAEVVEPVSSEELRAEAMRNRQADGAGQPPAEPPSKLLTKEELAALLEREP